MRPSFAQETDINREGIKAVGKIKREFLGTVLITQSFASSFYFSALSSPNALNLLWGDHQKDR